MSSASLKHALLWYAENGDQVVIRTMDSFINQIQQLFVASTRSSVFALLGTNEFVCELEVLDYTGYHEILGDFI